MNRSFFVAILLMFAFAQGFAQKQYDCKSKTFESLPYPGETIDPGVFCKGTMVPARSQAVLKIQDSKYGKAKGCRVDMHIQNNLLSMVKVVSPNKKTSKKLYKSLVEQFGNPGRMDESNGFMIYSWRVQGEDGPPMSKTLRWRKEGSSVFTMERSGLR